MLARHRVADHDDAALRGDDRDEVAGRRLRIERVRDRLRQAEEAKLVRELGISSVAAKVFRADRHAEVDERPAGPSPGGCEPRLAKSRLRGRCGSKRCRSSPRPGSFPCSFDLSRVCTELGRNSAFALPTSGPRIDQGEDLALPDRIADLLEDAEDGAGSARRQPGGTCLIVDELTVAGDELDHRGRPDGVDADARLLDGGLRRELDAAIMKLAAARILGPVLEGEGVGCPFAISVRDRRRRRQLGDFGMAQRTVVDAVLRAPAERVPCHQLRLALDADRFRDRMRLAPVALVAVRLRRTLSENFGSFQSLR